MKAVDKPRRIFVLCGLCRKQQSGRFGGDRELCYRCYSYEKDLEAVQEALQEEANRRGIEKKLVIALE